jgi:hypothetical protein
MRRAIDSFPFHLIVLIPDHLFKVPLKAAALLIDFVTNYARGQRRMRLLISAILFSAAIGLSGCFHVHQSAAVVEPINEPFK